jgi:hypothetical protein
VRSDEVEALRCVFKQQLQAGVDVVRHRMTRYALADAHANDGVSESAGRSEGGASVH